MTRPWQELVSAAQATGTYDSYVGDGFSVPWQVGLPVSLPIGLTMWIYKVYLDSNYPEAARIHDWCYTPYGSLISVTRTEADQAIRDRILAYGGLTSVADSAIVYGAVVAGGAPYFGESQTGFNPTVYQIALQKAQGTTLNGNIGGAGAGAVGALPTSPPGAGNFSGAMTMSIKTVMVFNQTTEPGSSSSPLGLSSRAHTAGWTEHVWWPSDDLDGLLGNLRNTVAGPNLLASRAALLPAGASILGVRLYQGAAGRGQFRGFSFPGGSTDQDIPQVSLLCNIPLQNSATIRRYVIRSVPDQRVVRGEYVGSEVYNQALLDFFAALGKFSSTGADLVVSYPVFTLTTAGVVTLDGVNNPFSIGAIVNFRSVLDSNGVRHGSRNVVTAVGPLNNQFTVGNWLFGDCRSGTVRQPTSSLHAMLPANASVNRVLTRRVGRPFEQYHGRRSRRRRPA